MTREGFDTVLATCFLCWLLMASLEPWVTGMSALGGSIFGFALLYRVLHGLYEDHKKRRKQ